MQTSHILNSNDETTEEDGIDSIKNIDQIVQIGDSYSVNNTIQFNNIDNDDENVGLLENTEINNDNKIIGNENKIKTRCLYLLDMLLSVVFFSPMSSLYWYGTWLYLDTFFINDDYKLSNFASWGIGLALLFPSYIFQQDFQRFYDYLKRFNCLGTWLRFLMRTIYIYLMCFAVVAQWRGLWNLLV
jgi:hypothetical protein